METFELPSGTEAALREMTGVEEELLTNPRLVRSGDAVNQVLRNCLIRLGDKTEVSEKDVLDLLSGDRLFLLVKLREISLGEEVELALACSQPSCRASNPISIDLRTMEVSKYPAEREFTVDLPSSNLRVRFVHLDGHREKRLAALKEPTITSGMLIRILDVGGKPPTKKLVAELTSRDRAALRKAMTAADGGPDTAIAVDCEACGAPIRTRLEGEPGFFFPEAR